MNRILYNTTFFVEPALAAEFEEYLRDIYIPATLNEGLVHPVAAVVRTDEGAEEGIRVAVQFFARDEAQLSDYRGRVQTALLQEAYRRWGQRVLCMPSIMDCLDLEDYGNQA